MSRPRARFAVALAAIAIALAGPGRASSPGPQIPAAEAPPALESAAPPLALLHDRPIDAAALGPAADEAQRVRRLAAWLVLRTGEDWARREGIAASEDELAELRTYNAAFARHDRAQRERKLAEIDARLASPGIAPDERERLQRFRGVLARLARYETDVDAGIEPAAPPDDATLAALIVAWKLDAALHRRYGGAVGWSPTGPYAHGARAALVDEYERRGWLVYANERIARDVRSVLARAPLVRIPDDVVDFTPFWRRPLVPSYMRD